MLKAVHGQLESVAEAREPVAKPLRFKTFAGIFFSAIALTLVPAVAIHQSTVLYYEGRAISHGAANVDEDGNFYWLPRPQGGKRQ